ncbi:MAG: diacylglycerol kinase family protein [Lachnospiraceae bacterium]|nr:diacylglycerol kinase family protein [Lachnospiraceae bacterium]
MKKKPLYRSFGYAFEGIFNTIKSERNMKIHCFMTVCVVIAGLLFRISYMEWLVCLVLFGLVTSLELVNTSLEAVVDLVTEERRPLAKKAKDAAAGAVLASAIFAAIIGLIIFLPKLPVFLHAAGLL